MKYYSCESFCNLFTLSTWYYVGIKKIWNIENMHVFHYQLEIWLNQVIELSLQKILSVMYQQTFQKSLLTHIPLVASSFFCS